MTRSDCVEVTLHADAPPELRAPVRRASLPTAPRLLVYTYVLSRSPPGGDLLYISITVSGLRGWQRQTELDAIRYVHTYICTAFPVIYTQRDPIVTGSRTPLTVTNAPLRCEMQIV